MSGRRQKMAKAPGSSPGCEQAQRLVPVPLCAWAGQSSVAPWWSHWGSAGD